MAGSLNADAEFVPPPNRGLITVLVMAATVMQTLDSTVANVALPHMQGSLAATQDQMGWVLTSYIVAAAIMIPLSGWLASEFGRRRVFLISVLLFTAASALCGLSSSITQIVLFRTLQGVGGAALVPLSQAVMFDINAPKDFGKAMALWGMGVMVGPILGPALGGWLTENYSWRWVFYINLPIGILCFLGMLATLPESRNAKSSRFDFFGFISLSVGIATLQLMLDRGQLKDWFSSPEIIAETAISVLGFYLFLVHMFSSRRPFLDAALFKDRNFSTASTFMFLVGMVIFSTLALLPPMLQNQMQYPVLLTGLVTAPRGMGTMVSMIVVGRMISHFDARLIITIGLSLIIFSLWQMSHFSLLMGYWPIVISGVTQGLGIGLVYVPLSTVAFSTLPGHLRNEGTAFFNLIRNIGASIGISVMMFLLVQNTQRLHSAMVGHITSYNIANNPALAASHFNLGGTSGLLALNNAITNQSAMIGYLDDFHLMMMVTVLTIPFLFLIKRVKPTPPDPHSMVLE
jgi:DHA2 family multidrug resistance protein